VGAGGALLPPSYIVKNALGIKQTSIAVNVERRGLNHDCMSDKRLFLFKKAYAWSQKQPFQKFFQLQGGLQ
jgi:hypothetical protein